MYDISCRLSKSMCSSNYDQSIYDSSLRFQLFFSIIDSPSSLSNIMYTLSDNLHRFTYKIVIWDRYDVSDVSEKNHTTHINLYFII